MTVPLVANSLTIRERILRELVRLHKAQIKGKDGYPFDWDSVNRLPFKDGSPWSGRKLSIRDASAVKEVRTLCQVVTLEVNYEWRIVIPPSCDPAEEANAVLGAIERRVNTDLHVHENADSVNGAQLAERSWVVGNDYVVDDKSDRQIEGVVFGRVLFRHDIDDPRSRLR